MADINWNDFAAQVSAKMAGRSFNDMVAAHPELNKAMLSRAINGHVISAANLLLICDVLRLEPFEFLRRDAVSSAAKRGGKPSKQTLKTILSGRVPALNSNAQRSVDALPTKTSVSDIVKRNQQVSVSVSREAVLCK